MGINNSTTILRGKEKVDGLPNARSCACKIKGFWELGLAEERRHMAVNVSNKTEHKKVRHRIKPNVKGGTGSYTLLFTLPPLLIPSLLSSLSFTPAQPDQLQVKAFSFFVSFKFYYFINSLFSIYFCYFILFLYYLFAFFFFF